MIKYGRFTTLEMKEENILYEHISVESGMGSQME